MNSQFVAKPPSHIGWRSFPKHFKHLWQSVKYILWQIVVPFNPRPDEIEPFPEPDPEIAVAESHVKQCQWIFDQAETRRANLEQKAQSTFALMLFLVPLLASFFVFVIGKGTTSTTLALTLVLTTLSAVFLLLAFVSAVRAVAVKGGETLFLNSVIHESGQFRKYSEGFHARGLLYCASMNTAMNDHIAQFVKGAHVLSAASVLLLLVAAIPTSSVFLRLPAPPTQTQIVGPVSLSFPELTALRDDVASLKQDVQKLSNGKVSEDQFKLLGRKVDNLEAKLGALQKAKPAASTSKTAPKPSPSSKP